MVDIASHGDTELDGGEKKIKMKHASARPNLETTTEVLNIGKSGYLRGLKLLEQGATDETGPHLLQPESANN